MPLCIHLIRSTNNLEKIVITEDLKPKEIELISLKLLTGRIGRSNAIMPNYYINFEGTAKFAGSASFNYNCSTVVSLFSWNFSISITVYENLKQQEVPIRRLNRSR